MEIGSEDLQILGKAGVVYEGSISLTIKCSCDKLLRKSRR